MKIVHDLPPFYVEIAQAVGVPPLSAVFTYGDTCYMLTDTGLMSPDLAQHEMTHMRQQRELAGGPDEWWRAWIADPEFRLDQELEAYRVQYRFRHSVLNHCAHSLSSMYGL